MEGLSTHVYKGIKKYWNRRGYIRLTNNNNERKAQARARDRARSQTDPAQAQRKRRRFWRVKISPRIRVGSPKRWLARLRDAYVNMMLKISSRGFGGGVGGFGGGGSVEYGFGYDKGRVVKEYDEKMIVEIYKSLMIAQGQIVSRAGNNINNNNNNNNNCNENGKISGSQNKISVSSM